MKKIIIILLICSGCAGSKFAVHQNELEARSKGHQRTIAVHNHFNKR